MSVFAEFLKSHCGPVTEKEAYYILNLKKCLLFMKLNIVCFGLTILASFTEKLWENLQLVLNMEFSRPDRETVCSL